MPSKRSSIRQLPEELRREVDRLLADGKYTIRQVTDHVRAMGADVSKSAVHRYSQDLEDVARDIRYAREMASAIGKELGAGGGDAGRMVIESMQALLLRARMQLGAEAELDPKAVGSLAAAARDLAIAFKSNVDTELKVRQQAAKDAAKAFSEAATERGLSSETVGAIKERILGIAKR